MVNMYEGVHIDLLPVQLNPHGGEECLNLHFLQVVTFG